MKRSKPTPLAGSTSKPRRESSRLRPASTSQQQQEPSPSSFVRIDTLSVADLRKYAHVVTVKNEEYKQRLKLANEMFVRLQEAYQRLKLKTEDMPKEVEEAVVVDPKRHQPAGNAAARQGKRKCSEDSNYDSVRRSTRKRPGRPTTRLAPDSRATPQSCLTASQLTEGLLDLPTNLQLATLAGEDDNREDEFRKENTGELSVDDTPGTEATPRKASTVRKRLMNILTSPVWETIEKKKKHQKNVHLGYEHVPAPEEPIKGLKLFGVAEPQLDEDKAFKYMEVVRKQDERAKLPAGFCPDCARFYRVYAEHGNFEEANAMAQRMCGHTIHQQTSRHRRKWEPPESPEDYWHVRPPEPHS